MRCEMCGSSEGEYRANIEGTILLVCSRCQKYGKVIEKMAAPQRRRAEKEVQPQKKPIADELVFSITQDYASKIKSGRERLGLAQADFAKLVNEKDSVLSKLETGSLEPNLKLAHKLEKVLHIKLVEHTSEDGSGAVKARTEDITIGDLITIKKR